MVPDKSTPTGTCKQSVKLRVTCAQGREPIGHFALGQAEVNTKFRSGSDQASRHIELTQRYYRRQSLPLSRTYEILRSGPRSQAGWQSPSWCILRSPTAAPHAGVVSK